MEIAVLALVVLVTALYVAVFAMLVRNVFSRARTTGSSRRRPF